MTNEQIKTTIDSLNNILVEVSKIVLMLTKEMQAPASALAGNSTFKPTEDPLCPECGGSMALRTNRQSGNKFWGCTKYPNCKGTRDENGLSREEREEQRLKRESYNQDSGFSFNRKRDILNEGKPE